MEASLSLDRAQPLVGEPWANGPLGYQASPYQGRHHDALCGNTVPSQLVARDIRSLQGLFITTDSCQDLARPAGHGSLRANERISRTRTLPCYTTVSCRHASQGV